MGAWEIIRRRLPNTADIALDNLVMLSRILKGMKKEFPKVNEFVRPGFDE